jgi:HAD superfamily hydrolase (TIGR01509 family)
VPPESPGPNIVSKLNISIFDDVKEGKPAPEGYLKAAERLVVNPEHCLVIEDSQGELGYVDISLWLNRHLAF